MRVGIDIDNTIICYDRVFATVAISHGFSVRSGSSKNEVKKWFHDRHLNQAFTFVQGEVYGSSIHLASVFDGVLAFIDVARRSDCQLFLVSHKTRYPMIGDKFDLRQSATSFLESKNVISNKNGKGVVPDNVFYEGTLAKKISRIAALNLDFFIDDLSQVFEHLNFPKKTSRVHFSRDAMHPVFGKSHFTFSDWTQILSFMFCGDHG